MSADAADLPPRTRTALSIATGVVAGGVGAFALFCLWSPGSVLQAIAALAAHVASAPLARLAARLGGSRPSEQDLVMLLAICAPGVGPAFAWTVSLPRQEAKRNAHAAFECEEVVRAGVDDSPELERELQVVSHAQVLRHGSLEEKRNLLRQLARIGERRYLLLLRRFLLDPEPELRLCAYAELAHVCQDREGHIAELRERTEAMATEPRPVRAAAHAELAEAKREYAAGGLLDDDMARYWFEQARISAERALELEDRFRPAERVLALALAELGDLERAWSIVSAWPDDAGPECDVARAELAFRLRDRRTCLDVAARLEQAEVALPEWLQAVAGRTADDEARAEMEVHT